MQLLRIDWNVLFTIINLLILYFGLRKFLIKPVTNVMEQRRQMIEGQMADAKKTTEQANELKSQYEDALKQAVEHAASVIQVEGSIGVGYDVEADQVKEMVGMEI